MSQLHKANCSIYMHHRLKHDTAINKKTKVTLKHHIHTNEFQFVIRVHAVNKSIQFAKKSNLSI